MRRRPIKVAVIRAFQHIREMLFPAFGDEAYLISGPDASARTLWHHVCVRRDRHFIVDFSKVDCYFPVPRHSSHAPLAIRRFLKSATTVTENVDSSYNN